MVIRMREKPAERGTKPDSKQMNKERCLTASRPTPAHGGHPGHTGLSIHAARCSVRNACTKASSLSLIHPTTTHAVVFRRCCRGKWRRAQNGVATTRTAKPWMLSRRVLWCRLAPPLTQLAIITTARSNTCCKHVVR
ncbi:hypothetical protein B0H12DRAFT_1130177 [Mycena haematopus]|nr:hypothetical protein B0H12DRAFT_1130177 [Mycena haematopus]